MNRTKVTITIKTDFCLQTYLILFIILFFFSTEIVASEWSARSSLKLRNQYDTNRSLTAAEQDSISAVSIIPDIRFSRNTEIIKSSITAKLQSTMYSEQNVRDTDVQLLNFKHKQKGLRNTFSIEGRYRRDTTLATLNDIEIDDDIDDDIDSDLGLVKVNVRRSTFRVEPRLSYNLSESYSLNLRYRYSGRYYSRDANTDLVEYSQNTYVLGLRKVLNQKNSVDYLIKRSAFNPDNNSKSENSSISVSYKHKLTTLSNVQILGGLSRTDSLFNSVDGSVYKISYENKAEISKINISLGQDVSGSSTGSLLEKVQLDLRYLKRITPVSKFFIRARAFENRSLGNNIAADRRFLSIEPKITVALTRNFTLDFSYRYRWEKFDNNNESANSDALFLGIAYSFDKLATRL